jgi:hypothetical protein
MARRRPEDKDIQPENLKGVLGAVQGVDLVAMLEGSEARTERLEFCLTPREKKLLRMLAQHTGVSMTKLVVTLAEVAASSMTQKQKDTARKRMRLAGPRVRRGRKPFGLKKKD